MKRPYLGFALCFATAAAAVDVPRCAYVEDAVKVAATCLFLGGKGKETESALITPRRKITVKTAVDMIENAAIAFETSAYHPAQITVLTDAESKGPSVIVEGAAARIQLSPEGVKQFRTGIQVCTIVDWKSNCKPLR
jgi:hypothetical protein